MQRTLQEIRWNCVAFSLVVIPNLCGAHFPFLKNEDELALGLQLWRRSKTMHHIQDNHCCHSLARFVHTAYDNHTVRLRRFLSWNNTILPYYFDHHGK